MTSLFRVVLLAGLLLTTGGLTLVAYFAVVFDTWTMATAVDPARPEAGGEGVFYESAERVSVADDGRRAGVKLLVAGVPLVVVGSARRIYERRTPK